MKYQVLFILKKKLKKYLGMSSATVVIGTIRAKKNVFISKNYFSMSGECLSETLSQFLPVKAKE